MSMVFEILTLVPLGCAHRIARPDKQYMTNAPLRTGLGEACLATVHTILSQSRANCTSAYSSVLEYEADRQECQGTLHHRLVSGVARRAHVPTPFVDTPLFALADQQATAVLLDTLLPAATPLSRSTSNPLGTGPLAMDPLLLMDPLLAMDRQAACRLALRLRATGMARPRSRL